MKRSESKSKRVLMAAPRRDLITRINVTPIIDVALVLVIILLVTAPMLSVADLEVNLPPARTRDSEDQRNVSITLGADGEVAVDRDFVSPELLRVTLAARLAEPGNEDVLVVVRADSAAPHSAVEQLLTEARAAGATHLAVATRQQTGGPAVWTEGGMYP
jgi:biopolymer transport protein TolR